MLVIRQLVDLLLGGTLVSRSTPARGVKDIMHNTLAASDYGLLDQNTVQPRPNYWVALLSQADGHDSARSASFWQGPILTCTLIASKADQAV